MRLLCATYSNLNRKKKSSTGFSLTKVAALLDDKTLYFGTKNEHGLDDAYETTMHDMNEFCILWLQLFEPNLIKSKAEQ